MYLWAGIDEAGYGPLLGPLVIAGTAFSLPVKPREGTLWELLDDALTDSVKKSDGRLVVADSKATYSKNKGLKTLEESVLCFAQALRHSCSTAGKLIDFLRPRNTHHSENSEPWFADVPDTYLPLSTTIASLETKTATLIGTLAEASLYPVCMNACPVLTEEYNHIVALTKNKSMLLWQKCGALLQMYWELCKGKEGFVLVDRHGGRTHYRKLLRDVFPEQACDIIREDETGSVYRISDSRQVMWVGFKAKADACALPVALASMTAKYIREIYMHAFNKYWSAKCQGIKATAGYAADAHRFLTDIERILKKEQIPRSSLVRTS